MAVTAGTGGTGTVDTTGDYIFQPAATAARSAGATSIQIWNEDAAIAMKVLVTGLHDSGAELHLPASKTTVVRFDEMAIREIHVKAVSGTPTVSWGVVAKTGASA